MSTLSAIANQAGRIFDSYPLCSSADLVPLFATIQRWLQGGSLSYLSGYKLPLLTTLPPTGSYRKKQTAGSPPD
jgi:hypothetical protein